MNSNSILAIVLVTLLLIVPVIFRLLPRRMSSRDPKHRYPGLASALIGLLCVAVVLYCEYGAINRDVPVAGDATIQAVVAGDVASTPDRMQFLFVVSDSAGLAPPTAILERVVAVPGSAAGRIDVSVEELDAELEIAFPDGNALGKVELELVSEPFPYSRHTSSGSQRLSRPGEVEGGDERAFHICSSHRDLWPGLRLRRQEGVSFHLLARLLYPGDRLEARAAVEVGSSLSRSLRERGQLLRTVSHGDWYPPDPVGRLMTEQFLPGALLLAIGLALLMYRQVSMLRGAALLVLSMVVITAAASRLECRRWNDLLIRGNAAERSQAVTRLSRTVACAPRAAVMLEEAFARESDPEVRATILLATVDDGNAMRELAPSRRIYRAALDDRSAEVGQARERVMKMIEATRPAVEEP